MNNLEQLKKQHNDLVAKANQITNELQNGNLSNISELSKVAKAIKDIEKQLKVQAIESNKELLKACLIEAIESIDFSLIDFSFNRSLSQKSKLISDVSEIVRIDILASQFDEYLDKVLNDNKNDFVAFNPVHETITELTESTLKTAKRLNKETILNELQAMTGSSNIQVKFVNGQIETIDRLEKLANYAKTDTDLLFFYNKKQNRNSIELNECLSRIDDNIHSISVNGIETTING